MLWIVLIAALGGAVPTFSKMALEVFPPFTFVLLRFIVALIVLVPVMLVKKKTLVNKNFKKIAQISLFGTGNVVFFALGVRYTTATVSQILYAAVPILATVLTAVILKENISKNKVIGVLLGFIGVGTIIISSGLAKDTRGMGTPIGNILVLLAVMSYAIYTVLSKKLQKDYSPIEITMAMIITTITMQMILVLTEVHTYETTITNVSIDSLFGIFYVGAIGTSAYFLLYQRVIKNASPVYASMIFYLQPIFTFIWSTFLLGEKLTASIVVGGIIALVGASLVMKQEKKPKEKDMEA